MPPPIDLTGRRFGALVALRRGPHKGRRTAWWCRCDCGRRTLVATASLSGTADGDKRAIRACEWCRSRKCSVCGARYLIAGSAATCGADHCRLEHRRATNAAHAAARELRDPGIHARELRAQRQRMRIKDPLRYQAMLEADRQAKRAKRQARTEIDQAEQRIADRDYYQRTRAERRAAWDRWIAAMTPEKRREWIQRQRDASREYRRRRALARLMADAQTLIARMEKDND